MHGCQISAMHIFMCSSFVRLTRFLARLMARPRVTLLTSDTLSMVICCRWPRNANNSLMSCVWQQVGMKATTAIFRLVLEYFSDGFPYIDTSSLLHFPFLQFPALRSTPAFFPPAFSAPPCGFQLLVVTTAVQCVIMACMQSHLQKIEARKMEHEF